MKFTFFFAVALFFLLLTSCAGPKRMITGKDYKELHELIEESPVFSSHFTGFVVMDPVSGVELYQKNADKFFTPASNTKIFTLYASLKILGDSLPILRYIERNDTIIFQGMGNPLVFHPDFLGNDALEEFFRQPGKIYLFNDSNFQDDQFGPGWSWADFQWYYQAERSPFPIHGNFIRVTGDSASTSLNTSPAFFKALIRTDTTLDGEHGSVLRTMTSNLFRYNGRSFPERYDRDIPILTSPEMTSQLLRSLTGADVRLDISDGIPSDSSKVLMGYPADTIYSRYMKVSDNFIAEQLLLMCAEKLYDTLSTSMAIEYVKDSLLQDLPDRLEWWDGSGLSRYNLFTPRTIANLLLKIYKEESFDRVKKIFAAGGHSGTIRNLYQSENGTPPYVYAKTGTLRNKHCLSGYLIARSGRIYIFSFMNNNYVGSTRPVQGEMQKVLEWLRDRL